MLGLAASSQAGAIRAQAAPRGCCRPRVCVLASARQGSSGGPTDAAAAAPSALPLAEGLSRRSLLGAAAAASGALLLPAAPAGAVQGSIAGRIPGLTGPNAEGYYTYKRPEGKSGAACSVRRLVLCGLGRWGEAPGPCRRPTQASPPPDPLLHPTTLPSVVGERGAHV